MENRPFIETSTSNTLVLNTNKQKGSLKVSKTGEIENEKKKNEIRFVHVRRVTTKIRSCGYR